MYHVLEVKEFDCKTCPFCNCALDMCKDFCADVNLHHGLSLFKCHNCDTIYEVVPAVIASWKAHALVRGEATYLKHNAKVG
jgi:hypothetical protein